MHVTHKPSASDQSWDVFTWNAQNTPIFISVGRNTMRTLNNLAFAWPNYCERCLYGGSELRWQQWRDHCISVQNARVCRYNHTLNDTQPWIMFLLRSGTNCWWRPGNTQTAQQCQQFIVYCTDIFPQLHLEEYVARRRRRYNAHTHLFNSKIIKTSLAIAL